MMSQLRDAYSLSSFNQQTQSAVGFLSAGGLCVCPSLPQWDMGWEGMGGSIGNIPA